MTDEEKAELEAKQAEEEAKAKAEARTKAQDDEPLTAEELDAKKAEEESKQLEADLTREREARLKAEKASAELAFKLREKKRIDDQDDEDVDEDKPLTARQLQSLLAKERETTRKEMLSDEASRLASKVSNNDTEKELVLEIYKNRTFPSHLSLEEQIEESYVIANKKKILGENSELYRALRGKNGVSRDFSTTHHDSQPGNQPKLAAGDASELARLGFKWNTTSRRYEKKLANGQTLVRDSKSGQTSVV